MGAGRVVRAEYGHMGVKSPWNSIFVVHPRGGGTVDNDMAASAPQEVVQPAQHVVADSDMFEAVEESRPPDTIVSFLDVEGNQDEIFILAKGCMSMVLDQGKVIQRAGGVAEARLVVSDVTTSLAVRIQSGCNESLHDFADDTEEADRAEVRRRHRTWCLWDRMDPGFLPLAGQLAIVPRPVDEQQEAAREASPAPLQDRGGNVVGASHFVRNELRHGFCELRKLKRRIEQCMLR